MADDDHPRNGAKQRFDSVELTLSDYLSILRRQKWVLLACGLIVFGVAAAMTYIQPPRYTTSATVLVRTGANSSLFPLEGAVTSSRHLPSEISYVESTAFQRLVDSATSSGVDVRIESDVDANGSPSGDSIEFVVTSEDPVVAADTAQAWAETYIATRHELDVSENLSSIAALEAAITELEAERDEVLAPLDVIEDALSSAESAEEIARLSSDRLLQLELVSARLVPIDSQLSSLNTSIATFRVREDLYQNPNILARMQNDAEVPTSPSSPDVVRNLALGAVAAGILGIGAGLVRESLTTRVATANEIGSITGVPHLATIPRARTRGRHTPGLDDAYQRVLSGLDLATAADQPTRVVLLSSARQGEGKTSSAVRLAELSARGGLRTLLVEADLHRPEASARLDVANRIGLVDYLEGKRTIYDVTSPSPATDNLDVIASGHVADVAAIDLLRRTEFGVLIEKTRELYDRIIIDGPPVLAVADALELGVHADCVLLVVRAGSVTSTELAEAHRVLRTAKAPVIGSILVGIDGNVENAYSSGYERLRR